MGKPYETCLVIKKTGGPGNQRVGFIEQAAAKTEHFRKY